MKFRATLLLLGAIWLLSASPSLADEEPLPPGAFRRFGSTHLRHGSGILASDLSPDGKLLATLSDRSVVLWDMAKEQVAWRRPVPDAIFAHGTAQVQFSPDGLWLACRHVSSLGLWEVGSGRVVLEPQGNQLIWAPSVFTPDSKVLQVLTRSQIRYYDVATGNLIRSIERSEAKQLLPDGKSYVQYDANAKCIVIRDLESDSERWRSPLVASDPELFSIDRPIASDGKYVMVLVPEKGVELRELTTGKLLQIFSVPQRRGRFGEQSNRVSELAQLFRSRNRLFLRDRFEGLCSWDIPSGKPLPVPHVRFSFEATNIHVAADGRTMVTTDEDAIIRRWNAQTGNEIPGSKAFVGAIVSAVSMDGRMLAIADSDGQLTYWSDVHKAEPVVLTQSEVRFTRHSFGTDLDETSGPVRALAFSPDLKSLATRGSPPFDSLSIWQLEKPHRRVLRRPEMFPLRARMHYDSAPSLQFHPTDRLIAASSDHRPFLMIDASNGVAKWMGEYASMALTHDGKWIVAALSEKGKPHTFHLLNAFTGVLIRTLRFELPESRHPLTLAFAPDDRQLVVGDRQRLLFVDVSSGIERKRIQSPDDHHEIRSFAFSPDGLWLLTGGSDGNVRRWDTYTSSALIRFEAHDGNVENVAFGPKGETAISAGTDGVAYLWDLRPKAEKQATSLDALWQQLGSQDGSLAYQAVWSCRDHGKGASAFLQGKITAIKPVAKDQVERLIRDLDSPRFKERDAATKQLEKIGEPAAPALEEALTKSPSLELRQRLQLLLDGMKQGTPETVRALRTVRALELAGSPEALATLRGWVKGAPEARLTKSAQAAVLRLEKPVKTK